MIDLVLAQVWYHPDESAGSVPCIAWTLHDSDLDMLSIDQAVKKKEGKHHVDAHHANLKLLLLALSTCGGKLRETVHRVIREPGRLKAEQCDGY